MGIACTGGAGGCGRGHRLLNGMAVERECPDVEVQHARKWGYPDEEGRGPCSGLDEAQTACRAFSSTTIILLHSYRE